MPNWLFKRLHDEARVDDAFERWEESGHDPEIAKEHAQELETLRQGGTICDMDRPRSRVRHWYDPWFKG